VDASSPVPRRRFDGDPPRTQSGSDKGGVRVAAARTEFRPMRALTGAQRAAALERSGAHPPRTLAATLTPTAPLHPQPPGLDPSGIGLGEFPQPHGRSGDAPPPVARAALFDGGAGDSDANGSAGDASSLHAPQALSVADVVARGWATVDAPGGEVGSRADADAAWSSIDDDSPLSMRALHSTAPRSTAPVSGEADASPGAEIDLNLASAHAERRPAPRSPPQATPELHQFVHPALRGNRAAMAHCLQVSRVPDDPLQALLNS